MHLTSAAPEQGPLIKFSHGELGGCFQKLWNIVSPTALRRDFPDYIVDAGKPLAPGLRSFAKILGGKQIITNFSPPNEALLGSVVHYTSGSLMRLESGGIILLLTPSHHNPARIELSKAIKATEVELCTTEEVISANPQSLTIFLNEREIAIAEGTPVPRDDGSSAHSPASTSFRAIAFARYEAYLVGKELRGKLVVNSMRSHDGCSLQLCADLEITLG